MKWQATRSLCVLVHIYIYVCVCIRHTSYAVHGWRGVTWTMRPHLPQQQELQTGDMSTEITDMVMEVLASKSGIRRMPHTDGGITFNKSGM